jgi:hypothetical protein
VARLAGLQQRADPLKIEHLVSSTPSPWLSHSHFPPAHRISSYRHLRFLWRRVCDV